MKWMQGLYIEQLLKMFDWLGVKVFDKLLDNHYYFCDCFLGVYSISMDSFWDDCLTKVHLTYSVQESFDSVHCCREDSSNLYLFSLGII